MIPSVKGVRPPGQVEDDMKQSSSIDHPGAALGSTDASRASADIGARLARLVAPIVKWVGRRWRPSVNPSSPASA